MHELRWSNNTCINSGRIMNACCLSFINNWVTISLCPWLILNGSSIYECYLCQFIREAHNEQEASHIGNKVSGLSGLKKSECVFLMQQHVDDWPLHRHKKTVSFVFEKRRWFMLNEQYGAQRCARFFLKQYQLTSVPKNR